MEEVIKKTEFSEKKVRVSQVFVIALSIVSIIGFLGIIMESFFNYNIGGYIEAALMFIIGIALVLEAKIKSLKSLNKGFNSNNFTHLITAIIGFIAIITGVFSIPQINVVTPAFQATKGIISVIAIVIIIVLTWIIE